MKATTTTPSPVRVGHPIRSYCLVAICPVRSPNGVAAT